MRIEVAGDAGVAGARAVALALPGRYGIGARERRVLSTVPGALEVIERWRPGDSWRGWECFEGSVL